MVVALEVSGQRLARLDQAMQVFLVAVVVVLVHTVDITQLTPVKLLAPAQVHLEVVAGEVVVHR
jgi:hypothetical protein